MVSVIPDGENAWEYYPYNAFYFLDELYRLLETHASIRTATFSEILAEPNAGAEAASAKLARPLPELVSGSWVYGDLSTWIGAEQKNRAWDVLASAKQSYNLVMASGRLNEAAMQAATRQLAICEARLVLVVRDYNPSTRLPCSIGCSRQSRQPVSAAATAGADATVRTHQPWWRPSRSGWAMRRAG